MKILVCCNLLSSVNTAVYPNHMQFWAGIGRNFGPQDVLFFSPRRMSIDRARNEAAKLALENEVDYLFFYDDDVLLPPDTMDLLLKADKPVIAGITLIRSYPFRPMLFEYKNSGRFAFMKGVDDYEDKITEDGTFAVDAVGFSCCLIKTEVLKKLYTPYFVTGPSNTEDVYFCAKVNNEIGDGNIFAHSKVSTGHIVDNYYVSPGNVDKLIKFEEDLNETLNPRHNKRNDRGNWYQEQLMEKMRRLSNSEG